MKPTQPQRVTRFAAISLVDNKPAVCETAFETREAAVAHIHNTARKFERMFGHLPTYPCMTVQVEYTEPDGLDVEFSDWQGVTL
jgi:hypothetical protein